MVIKFVENRLHETDEKYTAKTKSDCTYKTDMSLNIEYMFAIVPPSDTPFFSSQTPEKYSRVEQRKLESTKTNIGFFFFF